LIAGSPHQSPTLNERTAYAVSEVGWGSLQEEIFELSEAERAKIEEKYGSCPVPESLKKTDYERRMEGEFYEWYTTEKSEEQVAREFEEKYGPRPLPKSVKTAEREALEE
jgi:hypothetical protein